MNLFAKLEKSKNFWFLLGISFVFFLLRLPSLFEPYWYGDEGIYQTMATAMNNGSLLYKETWDNKPPLLYILYALFNGDQFLLRLVSLLFGILSIVTFFLLGKSFILETKQPYHMKNKTSLYIATFVFSLLLAIPLLEGNIANTENFMIIFPLLAAVCLFRYITSNNSRLLWTAGFLLSIETLFKIVGIFDFAAFGLFLFFVRYKSGFHLLQEIKTLFPYAIGYLIPIILTLFYFSFHGALQAFISGTLTQMVGYVGYGNMFFIPQGLLYIKILLLVCGIVFLFYNRAHIPTSSLFIYVWLLFSLFSIFFSQRPYPHYVLLLVPSFCLFFYLLIGEFLGKKERNKTSIVKRNIHVGVFIMILLLVFLNFNVYKKNIPYYQNFLSFMMGKISLSEYQSFFDKNVPRDYAIAQFLRMHTKPNETVFLWGNSAQIYKMSQTLPPGRYTVEYHITGSSNGLAETAKAIEKEKPRFIVIMSQTTFPFDLSRYRYVFSIYNNPVYEYNL